MEISKTATFAYQKQSSQESITIQKVKGNSNMMTLSANISYISEGFSISSTDINKSLNLIYDKAITAINIELEESHGKNAVQNAYEAGIDFSPKATAERIVNFATSFFDMYREKNSDMSDAEALGSYMDIIGSAIDEGFGEATEILNSLNVFNGEIKDNADQTYDLIQQGLVNFKENRL